MKRFCSVFVLIWLCIAFKPVNAQTGNVRGEVVDGQTGLPLVGAAIRSLEGSEGVITDANGRFSLSNVSLPVDLRITHVGYEPLVSTVNSSQELKFLLTPVAVRLQDIVVTAFEGQRRLIETPATISRITAPDFERFDLRSPQQALSTIPGVKVESTTIGRYRVRIRGGNLGIVGHNDSYKMYWNGIPITLADGFPPLAYIDLGSIGSLDVIRGPSGSIYGAGLAGVGLFENKTGPNDGQRLEVDGFTGSYGTYRYGMAFSSGGEHGDIRIQYANVHTDGYREEAGSDNEFLNVFGRVFPSDKQTLSFMGILGDRNYGIPGNLNAAALAEDRRQANFSPELDNGLTGRNLMIGLGNEYRFNPNWSNNTTLSYQVLEGTFLIGNDFFVSADQTTTSSFAFRNATNYGFSAFGNPAQLVFGMEYTRGLGNVGVFGNGFESALVSNRETINELTLGFAQLEFTVPGNWQFTLGGSYNNFRLEFQEFLDLSGVNQFERKVQDFSPRIAVVKPIKENLVVHANISKGFAPPPRSAFDNSNETVNEDLESTKGWNKEIGIRGTVLDDRLSMDLTLYRLDETDVILPRVINTIGTIDFIRNENAGAIDRQGIELALQYQLLSNSTGLFTDARIWANYNYMNHEFEEYSTLNFSSEEVVFDGKKIPGVHPHSVVSGFDLRTSPGIYLFGTYSFYDTIYLNNANDASDDAYQLLDLKLGIKRSIGEHITLDIYGGINNLFNADYSQMHGLNSGFGGFFDPAMDRNQYAGLKLSYLFR